MGHWSVILPPDGSRVGDAADELCAAVLFPQLFFPVTALEQESG